MNKAILLGRLTKDPELRTTANGISVCSFTVAVDRRFKNAQGERETDFIPVVCWRGTAEFVAKYFSKGQMIGLVGSIQVRSWDDEKTGERKYMTEVLADEVHFAGYKSDNQGSNNYNQRNTQSAGSNADDLSDLPFEIGNAKPVEQKQQTKPKESNPFSDALTSNDDFDALVDSIL